MDFSPNSGQETGQYFGNIKISLPKYLKGKMSETEYESIPLTLLRADKMGKLKTFQNTSTTLTHR
jgi:hypothetical protein